MGIIHRREKDYEQARRAFLFALKCDPKSENTMRELYQLQIHLRDFAGFEETSRKMLVEKPGVMSNWVTLSAACYANRNYSGVLQAVDSMLKFNADSTSKSRMQAHEANEVVFIAVRSLEAQGKTQEALTFLNKNKKLVCDEVARADFQGRLSQRLGNEAQAVEHFERLLQYNSANLETYKKIISAKGVEIPEGNG